MEKLSDLEEKIVSEFIEKTKDCTDAMAKYSIIKDLCTEYGDEVFWTSIIKAGRLNKISL